MSGTDIMGGTVGDTADDTLPLGLFHEISLSTRDLAASVDFWRSLGWDAVPVRPVWSHPYAALSRSGIVLGLHQYRFPSPSVTCVHPDIAGALAEHRDAGMSIAFARTGPDCFNEFGFRDPHGHMVTLLEAPTHEAPASSGAGPSGEVFFSLPADDIDLGLRFWAVLGAAGHGASPHAWPCRRVTAGGVPLAFHAPALCDRPALVAAPPSSVGASRIVESPEGLRVVVPAA